MAAGNGKLMDELGVKWQECRSVGTIVHMAVDGEYAGHIVISDVVKSDARDAIAALKRAGVQKTVMLTGDIKKVADKVIYIPRVRDTFMPITASVPLQLLARAVAVNRGCDVDQPRNLAKSVTVE